MNRKKLAISSQRQRGITFLGLLFIGIIVAMVMVTAAKVVPSIVEYQSIVNAVERAKDQQTVADIQNAFDKQADIDDITSIRGKDLDIYKENDRIIIRFTYDKEIVLVHPVSLLIHYSGGTKGV